ncbi:hypothetical protein EB155_01230, partial [archaeon]|nr:hypothetical protein [archaeon]
MQIKYKPENTKFEKTRIKGSKSKATATVRGVQVKSRNNQTRSFLDLIYINGAFEENEEIIGYDIITGDELTRSNVLKSIIGVEVADGGIGHKVKDEFSFSDGIGQVSHLEKYSITNIKINNPGVFYAEGDYVQFDNAYTGATTYANAHIDTVHTNHALSDYINFLNNSLKLDPSKTYEKTNLYEHIESNTNLLSTSTNNYYKIYGSIDKLKINKSGLNYKFEPRISVLNTDPQAQNLYLYELYIDTLDVNTYSLTTDSIVSIGGEPAFYAGSKYLTDENLYFEGLANSGILAETPYVDTFYAPASLASDIANTTLEFFSNATSTQTLNLLDKSYDSNTTLKVDIINFATYFELGETAKLEPVLGYGVSKIKITDAGLLVNDDNEICFINGPQKRDEVSNNLIHPLDTSLNYKYGILLDPIEEYVENNSNLSSEKHIQDNYYYQSFSYEITTKIPAEVIEPLLLDELHPAGFIAFIRNKIDEEVSMHLKVQEFPRIEMLSENNSFELEVEPYIVQMQEKFINMNEDALIDYVEVELDNEQYADTTLRDSKVEPELENVNLIDVFEGFRLYVEDCLIRPDSKSFQEFRKCDLGPFFDYTDLPFFDDFGDTDNSATFDSDGSCIPTGYGTSKEYSRLEKEMFYDYSKFAAFDSFYKIISVEDQANWLADPINRYTGTIGSRYDFEITNHKAVIEEVLNLPTLQNKGGKIVIRDSLGSVSNFLFDNEFSYFDANLLVDISLNFSGEAFNYTPNPVFYFDSTDANNLIYDFSSKNTINLICSFPHHEHYSFNFSNEPKLAYESVVSGNTLESRGSYLPTAEILTKRGYIQIQEVRLNDQVAIVNDDGTSTWRSPNQVIRQKYTGIMYKFSDYNRMSVTVTPSQDLVVYRENQNSIDDVGAKKVKASRLNINKSIYDRFAIVDSDLVGTYNNVIKDYIPIVERIHRETVYYDGDVYCLVFDELSEAIEMEYKVNNIDIELLQFHSKINNDYTLPKFEPIDVYRTNHTQVKNHITVDVEKQDFVLYLPTSNSVLFDFNTNKDNDTYVSFKSEAGLTNATKILNYEGPSFDNVDKPRTFDADKRFTFDNTGQRFQVNMERMYLGSNHVLTKVPVGQEQEITYTKELNFDYFSYIDGILPKDCLDVSEDKQEFLVSNVNNKTYSLNMLPDTADVYLNSTLLYKSKDYEIIGNTLHILILLNLNDVITVYMKSSGTCNTMPVELYTYEMLNIKPQEIKFTPKNVLITEKDFLLYPKEFGPPVTFDLATLSPPGCLNGSFDYFSANNISAYKFDSNTGQLSFDYDRDPCVTTQAEKPLDRYITFDSFRRTFDQTNDFYIKTEQYIEPEQILTNANDSDIVNNKQNQTRLKTNGAEIFKIGETMGSSIVATIKNFRVDLKKKFFDSLIWTFDRDYTYERLNPREHSGFDSAYEPSKVNYECIDLFFDSDDVFLDTESIGYVVRKNLRPRNNPEYYFDNPFVYFDQGIGIGFSNEARPFNTAMRSKDPCVFYTEPFPYDDVTKNISLDLELNYTLDAYGPYNLSKSFDSAEPGHGFDKDGYPFFDNEQGGKKPFVTPENVIINVDTRDVSVASGRNDPIQTLILSAEDAYNRELTGITEQVLVNWAQIVICTRDVIYEEDVISDFEFNIIRPFLADGSCDPSSTKGTYAEPDYLLINRPNVELFTEVSENPTILYDEASFIDATVSDAHTLHTEVEATYNIFSCDPIRYTDIIYEYRRDRISPYILDTCPGDDRILRSETDFEYTLLNEYTYYANTQYFEPHEIEIYSHSGNDLYPDKAHLLAANNTAIVTFEYPEIEVAQHLGSRNCAISNAELVDNYLDVNILDCHLKEVMRYWIGDTVYTTKTQVFSKLELQSNTETILNSYENDVLYLDPLFIDATSTESEYKVDQYFDMEILDRNPHIWLGQMIGSKLNQYITEKSYPKTILNYVKDKIPSVSVEQETEILHPREFKVSNTVMEDVSTHSVLNNGVSYIDASIVDENKFIQGYHTFIKDRNVFVNVKDGLFTNRLKEVLDDYLLSRKLIDYEGDTIPSVKALGEQVLLLDNFANAMFFTTDSRRNDIQDLIELNSTVFSLDTIHLDSTVSTAEQSKAIQDRNVPDRNKVVSTDKRFNLLMLEEVIEPKDLKLTILDYSKDHIPTVSVDSRPSFKQYRTAYFDFSANTTSDMSTIGDKNHIYIDATSSLYEFDEIEDDMNLLSDINFISPDDVIGTYYEYPILDVYKKRIRENRYDTSRTVYVKERHEFEIDNRIKPNPLIDIGAFDELGLTFDDDVHRFEEIKERAFDGAHYEIEYQQDTILYQDDALNVDASNEYEEFDEIEYDRTICDLHSVLPLDEKVFGTLWEYYTIFEKDLKNKIVQDGRECIETVRVDPRPNFEVERTVFNDLQSNTKQEFTVTNEDNYLFI